MTGFSGMEVFTILTKHLSPIKSHTLVLDVNGTYSCINVPEEIPKIKLLFDENSGWELVTHALDKKEGNPVIKFVYLDE